MTWPDTYFVFSMSSCHSSWILPWSWAYFRMESWEATKLTIFTQDFATPPEGTGSPSQPQSTIPSCIPTQVCPKCSFWSPLPFLELSDTANVRFQDVFLKFWSNFYHLKLLTVANIWQIPTKANVNFPFDPSIPMVKLSSLHQSLIHQWEQQPQDYIPLDLAPQEVQLDWAPSDWAPANDWWSPGCKKLPRPQALSRIPSPVNFSKGSGWLPKIELFNHSFDFNHSLSSKPTSGILGSGKSRYILAPIAPFLLTKKISYFRNWKMATSRGFGRNTPSSPQFHTLANAE